MISEYSEANEELYTIDRQLIRMMLAIPDLVCTRGIVCSIYSMQRHRLNTISLS